MSAFCLAGRGRPALFRAVGAFVPATLPVWGVLALTRAATSLPAALSLGRCALVPILITAMCVLAGTFALRVLRQAGTVFAVAQMLNQRDAGAFSAAPN